MRPDVALPLLALLAVGALHAVEPMLAPPLVALRDVPAHEGGRVAVDAHVLDVRHGARGRFLWLADDVARLPVLAGAGDGPARGDRVRVVGVVTRLDDGPGLSAQRIDVVDATRAALLLPDDVARAPERHLGTRVRVEGDVRGDWLVGHDARLRWTGVAPEAGAGWRVAEGIVDYDARHARYVLRVDAWTPPS